LFTQKCPGQDMRYWTADDVHEEECPNCGEIIEFFKTDIRLRCRNCKTRVANPRFDMGCAEWCAHAEMCLGPGARGIQKKSFKTILEEEFERLGGKKNNNSKAMKEMISTAENKCRRENVDLLAVVAAIVILTLVKLSLVDDAGQYIDRLAEEHELPGGVVNQTKILVEGVQASHILDSDSLEEIAEKAENDMERVVAELFFEHGQKLYQPAQ